MITDALWQLLARQLEADYVRWIEGESRRLVRAYPRFVCPVALGDAVNVARINASIASVRDGAPLRSLEEAKTIIAARRAAM